MEYHLALKFRESQELLIRLNDTDLAHDYLCLFARNYQRQLPLLRDQGAYDLQRMKELAAKCKEILNWDWIKDRYDDYEITTKMHKDIEQYLSQGFKHVPIEHDALLHELHICLHSIQRNNQRTTIQLEWFNDDGFPLKDYDFEFTHDYTLGAIMLQNPYVGHPPDWLWKENDHTNVWQTCRFHDFVRPGLVINMQGNLEKTIVPFTQQDEYLDWWETVAPDFLKHHGKEVLLYNTGRPVIGYIINNKDLIDLQSLEKINFEYVRFNPLINLVPRKQSFQPIFPINREDYDNIAGPSWPSYEEFIKDRNPASSIIQEILELTGIDLKIN